jgi:hypothetical protein
MLKVMAFLVKKQGLDTGDLIDYYETHHVPLILSLAPAPDTYRRNYLLRDATANGPDDFVRARIRRGRRRNELPRPDPDEILCR